MRACEGCRRRKIKCDAATTNTWPCSACIRLRLHCVRPNGYDGSTDDSIYDTSYETARDRPPPPCTRCRWVPPSPQPQALYAAQTAYPDSAGLFQQVAFDPASNLHYTTVPAAHRRHRPWLRPERLPHPPRCRARTPTRPSRTSPTSRRTERSRRPAREPEGRRGRHW